MGTSSGRSLVAGGLCCGITFLAKHFTILPWGLPGKWALSFKTYTAFQTVSLKSFYITIIALISQHIPQPDCVALPSFIALSPCPSLPSARAGVKCVRSRVLYHGSLLSLVGCFLFFGCFLFLLPKERSEWECNRWCKICKPKSAYVHSRVRCLTGSWKLLTALVCARRAPHPAGEYGV